MSAYFRLLLVLNLLQFISIIGYGQSRWLQEYFPGLNVVGQDFVESYDNGYLITGKFGPNYVAYNWLIKTNINGQVIWSKTFGLPDSYIGFFSVDQDTFGNIFLSGGSEYYDSSSDPLIMKLNACGEKQWCLDFNTPGHFDYAHSIVATDDGGCAALLRYTGNSYHTDRICMVRIGADGQVVWKQCYNSSDTNLMNEDSRDLIITPHEGFLITATCDYLDTTISHLYWPKQYYIKTDSLGNKEWETVVFTNDNLSGGDAWTTTLNPDSNYYYSSVSHYYFEINFSSPALIKLDLYGNVVDVYDIVSGYINGGLTHSKFINDSTLADICAYGDNQEDIVTLAALIDTLGNMKNSFNLGLNTHGKVLRLTTDSKLVFLYHVLQNDQFDIYLRKLNQNLEDDTIYTRPFTYDSLCPYQIVSDTIVPVDCGLIVGIEEQGGGEAGKQGSGEAGKFGDLA